MPRSAANLALPQPLAATPIAPSEIRFIRLGPGGAWFERCMRDGLIEFGHRSVPHAVASRRDPDEIQALLVGQGRTPGKAKDFAREILDFYRLDGTALWVTIGAGRLWWVFAEPEVFPLTGDDRGARARRVIGAWRDTDLSGSPLRLETLSTRLTQVAGYRQTICGVAAQDYLLRRINGVVEPAVIEAKEARARLVRSVEALIQNLDWRDFEVFVDLVFAASGWRRVSGVGGPDQADTDLVLEQPGTGEIAAVQVKARASGAVLADYVRRFQASQFQRCFFVTHTLVGAAPDPGVPGVHLWLGERLAEQAVRAGLIDWLIEKSR